MTWSWEIFASVFTLIVSVYTIVMGVFIPANDFFGSQPIAPIPSIPTPGTLPPVTLSSPSSSDPTPVLDPCALEIVVQSQTLSVCAVVSLVVHYGGSITLTLPRRRRAASRFPMSQKEQKEQQDEPTEPKPKQEIEEAPEGTEKIICLGNKGMSAVQVTCSPGSFILDHIHSSRHVVSIASEWIVKNIYNHTIFDSFFTTTNVTDNVISNASANSHTKLVMSGNGRFLVVYRTTMEFWALVDEMWTLTSHTTWPACVSPGSFQLAVDISYDGKTVAIGDPSYNSQTGTVFIYYSSDPTNQAFVLDAALTMTDDLPWAEGALAYRHGFAVSLSADGRRVAFSSPGAFYGTGAAWVLEKSSSDEEWYPMETELSSIWYTISNPGDVVLFYRLNGNILFGSVFGHRISLSKDGNTLLISDHGETYDGYGGVTYLFQYDSGRKQWMAYGDGEDLGGVRRGLPFGYSTNAADAQGLRMTTNHQGTTFAVGAPASNVVYIYSKQENAVWNRVPYVLTCPENEDEKVPTGFGTWVEMTADGYTLAVGTNQGQVHYFQNTTGQWTARGSFLGTASVSTQETRLSINHNGNRMALLLPGDDTIQIYE